MTQWRNDAMCKICKLSPGDRSPNFRASNASEDWQAALQQETMCATLFSTVSTCFSIFLVLLACVCLKLFSGNSRDQNATGEAWGFSPSHDPRNGVWIDIWPEHWGMTMRQIRKLMDECKETLIRHTGSQWSHAAHAWFIFIPVAPSCTQLRCFCATMWHLMMSLCGNSKALLHRTILTGTKIIQYAIWWSTIFCHVQLVQVWAAWPTWPTIKAQND